MKSLCFVFLFTKSVFTMQNSCFYNNIFDVFSCHRLKACHLSETHCEIVASALKSDNSNLVELDMTGNKLQDSGLNILSAGLSSPDCRLETLRWVCWLELLLFNQSFTLLVNKGSQFVWTKIYRSVIDFRNVCFSKWLNDNFYFWLQTDVTDLSKVKLKADRSQVMVERDFLQLFSLHRSNSVSQRRWGDWWWGVRVCVGCQSLW